MTALGLIFIAAYLAGAAIKGRVGIIAVAAGAIPFNDSAAVVIGAIPISPFYLGMLVYLPLIYLDIGLPRPGSTWPWALGIWAGTVTVIGPTLFSGMPVVASGVGLDQQVDRLSELAYTSSNFAQVAYLILNLAILMALASSNDTKPWIPLIPAVVGTSVAMAAWIFRQIGIEWPQDLFYNNPRNYYAYVETPRLAAQFSEPSHLGAFALTSAVLLSTTLVVQRPRPAIRAIFTALIAADVLLIIESASAGALAGAAIFAVVAALWASYLLVSGRLLVSHRLAIATLLAMCVALASLPAVIAFIQNMVEYKLRRGTSIEGRTSADLSSWRIFLDSGTLGVGLGSNRSSSLLLLLLSTIGLVGTVLFLLVMGRAIRDGSRDRGRHAWAAGITVLLAAEFFSLADLVAPMIWFLAGFCWNASTGKERLATSTNETTPPSLARAGGRSSGRPPYDLQAIADQP